MSRDTFTFDGISSADYSAYVYATDSMEQAPARVYDTYTVPGRSGALIVDRGNFPNVDRDYGIVITEDSADNISALRNVLASRSGYCRLTDTFDTQHYFMAYYHETFSPTMSRDRTLGKALISFERKPQRWLLSGEAVTTLTAAGTIDNPTLFSAQPLLRVTTTRSAASVLGVGSTDITIKRQGVIYIDCATGRAYNGATPLDAYIALSTIDFPVLAPGSTGISLGTGISKVEITPRWWEL